MIDRFESNPAKMIVHLSPCIRPPHYEIDSASKIIRQFRTLDVQHIHDSGTCTACDLGRYYSYRAEKGKTGRMLAVLGMTLRRVPRLRSRSALSISASGAVAARFVTIHTRILPA